MKGVNDKKINFLDGIDEGINGFKINTDFDETTGQIEHIMYHIGHCEAMFRENNIKTKKYIEEE
jgi:hypothetical protein